MKSSFVDGAIVVEAQYYERVKYNVSNQILSAIFDGRGDVCYYAHDYGAYTVPEGINIWINGKQMEVCTKKTVKMIGRKQTIEVDLGCGTLIMEQFLDVKSDGVYFIYTLNTNDANLNVDVCMFWPFIDRINPHVFGQVRIIKEDNNLTFSLNKDKNVVKFFPTFDKERNFVESDFDCAYKECNDEIASVKVPEGLDPVQKAMFYSCYFCSLENYKEKGDFKGFMAGHGYLFPMRTYYRDSYYTVLPMYRQNLQKVKNQIITLARGINQDGSCPSAVFTDFKSFWADHFDSPSFFAIMLYDYVKFSGDTSILDIVVNERTILDSAKVVIEKLSQREDKTGLLYKEGLFNKRDWADCINRYGYVTYDEVLYARANECLSVICSIKGEKELSTQYHNKFIKIKSAINDILWDDKLGYYVNYVNEDFTEDNLSVDIVFAALFDIADDNRAITMLKSMERLLESKNNADVKLPDFGVMTVWPFYKKTTSGIGKSAQPYTYHNGANWPYWTAIYALAKRKYNMEYKDVLQSWFTYNVEKENYTPIEYFSPACKDGALLQAWSGAAAFVLDNEISDKFFD